MGDWTMAQDFDVDPTRAQSVPFPLKLRRDVVAVSRKGQAPVAQTAKGFGGSESSAAMAQVRR